MATDTPIAKDQTMNTLPSPARRTVEITDDDENLIVDFIPATLPKTSNP